MFQIDAQSAFNFLVAQLTRIEPEVYRTKYPNTDWEFLVPVDATGPEWVKSITFFSLDEVGQAKFLSGGGDDIPYADVIRTTGEEKVYMAGVGYEYNMEELATSQMIGANLTADKASAARRVYNQFMYALAIRGKTEKNMTGIVNNASVTAGNFANDGTGSSRLWADKTPSQIVRDINSLLGGIYSTSLTTELANTLLLPIDLWIYLAGTAYSTNTMETIASFIQRTNLYTLETGNPLTIRAIRGLEDDGASGTGRVIAYDRSPDVLKIHVPMPHRFLPVWQNGPMRFSVPGIFRTGGVEVRRPVAMRYGDGAIA